MPLTFQEKVRNIFHLERSFALVFRASRRWTLLSFFCTAFLGVLPLASLYLVKLIIDAVTAAIASGGEADALKRIAVLVAFAAIIEILIAALRNAGNYITEAQSVVVTDYVASVLHTKSASLDLAFYENPAFRDTLHRAKREGPYRPTRIVQGLVLLVQNGISLVAIIGMLFIFHWSAGVLLLLSTLPGLVVQLLFARKNFAWQQRRTQMERKASYFSDVLTGDRYARELRLYGLGEYFITAYNSLRISLRGEQMQLSARRNLADFCAQTIAVAVLFACLSLIVFKAVAGSITVGDIVMYFQAFQRGTTNLKNFLSILASLYEDNMFVANFFSFLDLPTEIKDPADPVPVPSFAEKPLVVDGVTFRYPGERQAVLDNFSLTINPGEIVALVGANGAGKSTIAKLLCRLYDPDDGELRLGGTPLRSFALADLRREIAVVLQDYARYYTTVGDNICFGNIDRVPGNQEIEAAAEKANADGFIAKLPAGYDTILGRWFTGGEELSLGEWQKIALARAFLRKGSLIILDEPTASLDTESEYHLFTKFRELIAGNSALLISHRFSTVRMADRICVLSHGRIAEQGTHAELMQLDNGIYAGLYAKQAVWMQD